MGSGLNIRGLQAFRGRKVGGGAKAETYAHSFARQNVTVEYQIATRDSRVPLTLCNNGHTAIKINHVMYSSSA